jgi:hypothetical protein
MCLHYLWHLFSILGPSNNQTSIPEWLFEWAIQRCHCNLQEWISFVLALTLEVIDVLSWV